MNMDSRKFWQSLLVVWFVLLQTLSPFLHAHANGQSVHTSHGIHIHQNDGVAFSGVIEQSLLKASSIQEADAMVIGVGSGIKAQGDQVLWLVLFFSLFALPIFSVLLRTRWQPPVLSFISIRRRTRLNPRAPPCF